MKRNKTATKLEGYLVAHEGSFLEGYIISTVYRDGEELGRVISDSEDTILRDWSICIIENGLWKDYGDYKLADPEKELRFARNTDEMTIGVPNYHTELLSRYTKQLKWDAEQSADWQLENA